MMSYRTGRGMGQREILQRFITDHSSCVVLPSAAFPVRSSLQDAPALICHGLINLSVPGKAFQKLEV